MTLIQIHSSVTFHFCKLNYGVFYLKLFDTIIFPLSVGSLPAPLTPDYGAPDVSYADGVFDPHFSRYITVMEGTSHMICSQSYMQVQLQDELLNSDMFKFLDRPTDE
jgi:hypothetical protein